MAHTNVLPVDFTHPIKRNGSLNIGVKQVLIRTLRALGGRSIQNGNATAFAATTVVPVSGLSFKVRKGKQYRIQGIILPTSDGTSGMKLGFALSGSSTATGVITYTYQQAATTTVQQVVANCLNSNSTGVAAVELICYVEGWFIPDVSGIAQLQAGTFTGTTAGSINAGSAVTIYRTFS